MNGELQAPRARVDLLSMALQAVLAPLHSDQAARASNELRARVALSHFEGEADEAAAVEMLRIIKTLN